MLVDTELSAGSRRNILIVGDGPAAARCRGLIDRTAPGRFRVVGVVAPDRAGDALARLARQPRRAARAFPSRVIVALDDRRGRLPVDGLVALRFRGIRVQLEGSFVEETLRKIPVRSIRPADLLYSGGFRMSPWKLALKNASDRAIALALLVVTAPLLVAAALAATLTAPGPVLCAEERVGLRGRHFRLLKLRTAGRWLRRTRLDTLPQLWNVLRGDMSLVGPRPERPAFVARHAELSPYFTLRHAVRPGITGWAQVNERAADDEAGTLETLSYDLYYIKHFSPVFDAEIFLRTALTAWCGDGA